MTAIPGARQEMSAGLSSCAGYLKQSFKLAIALVIAGAAAAPAIVQKLNIQVSVILQNPEVREQFAKLGIGPVPMKPDEFAKFVRDEISTYKRIVKDPNIQPL